MMANEALRWIVAVLLLAATLYAAFRAVTVPGPAARTSSVLQALMTAAMALMLVPGSQWPLLPQVLLFAVGAWWFMLQAVSRRVRARDDKSTVGRVKLIYHAAAMASMVFMLAAAGFWPVPPSGAIPSALDRPVPAPHHGASAAAALAAPAHGWSVQPALVPAVASALAVVFGLASVLWALRLILQVRAGSSGRFVPAALRSHPGGLRGRRAAAFRDVADTAVEVVGAAALALMFAAWAV